MNILSLISKEDFVFADDVPLWLNNNYQIFLVPSLVYPVFVNYCVGKFDYKAKLKFPFFIWNSIMCIYSGISSIILVPKLISKVITHGYDESICVRNVEMSYLYQPWGRWILLFVLSKLIELGDTVFLVLSNRNVPFIHLYHHTVTLVIAYIQAVKLAKTMEWAVCMNLVIHTWMYGYYAFSCYYPVKGNRILTKLQISQMIHGAFMCIYQAIYCKDSPNDTGAITIYTIYTVLFINMYSKKYKSIKQN